jgi:predicted secreted protein
VALALAAGAGAAEEEARNRVSFGVVRETEVANDRATAVLAASAEDSDAAAVADRVNQAMTWAVERVRQEPAVAARSGGYHTYPVEHEGKIRRWRARQELVVETSDVQTLTRVIGELQSRLELASIGFSVSPERRREVEDALIAEAITAFRARAELVRGGFDAAGWTLVQASVDGGGGPPPVPVMQTMRTLGAEDMVAQPSFEAGTSRVSVGVHGTIELR